MCYLLMLEKSSIFFYTRVHRNITDFLTLSIYIYSYEGLTATLKSRQFDTLANVK